MSFASRASPGHPRSSPPDGSKQHCNGATLKAKGSTDKQKTKQTHRKTDEATRHTTRTCREKVQHNRANEMRGNRRPRRSPAAGHPCKPRRKGRQPSATSSFLMMPPWCCKRLGADLLCLGSRPQTQIKNWGSDLQSRGGKDLTQEERQYQELAPTIPLCRVDTETL